MFRKKTLMTCCQKTNKEKYNKYCINGNFQGKESVNNKQKINNR